jgi:SAM-dependent methyltransferase
MQNTPFNVWFDTAYYHLLYAHRDENEATEFIDRLVHYLNPPIDARMLDIACGKGRHALQLAQKGFCVAGIDLSPSSIESARTLEQDNLEFLVHDMRNPIPLEPVDYAFNFFTSFGYFENASEDQQAIASMQKILKSDGCLIMDYLNTALAESQLIPYSEYISEGIHFVCERTVGERFIHKKIRVHDPKQTEPLLFEERVARYRLKDFELLFEAAGLAIETCFGNYTLEAFDASSSPRLILVARKK